MIPAVKLVQPCACGSRYGYLMLDTSDEEAEELPIITRCARCRKEVGRSSATPTTEPS